MKKLISIILCLAMLCGIAAVPTYASSSEPEWDGDPVIFIQGFTGSPLIKDKGLDTEETILGPGSEFNIQKILSAVPSIVMGIAIFALTGNSILLSSGFGDLASDKLDKLACLADGSSKYNISTYPHFAEEASAASLVANGEEAYIPEVAITDEIRKTVPDEYFFVFNSDWRMGQIDNSERLDWFIGEVLRITGKDKVDIYALSHGGQTAATYLYYHGTENEVDNVVLNVPAICGTSIVKGLLGDGAANFSMDEISRFLAVMLHTEADLRILGDILPGRFLNDLLKVVFVDVFQPHALRFGSIWDFMDVETYKDYKAKYLNPTENAGIIEKADKMHFDCMANIGEGLRLARESGVNVSIMSNYGTRLGSGEPIDADFVIDTVSTSGAYCAVHGEQFEDGYTAKGTVCNNAAHNHISPDRTVDASCAYLPEHTWFVRGQYHGQAAYDSYTMSLLLKLLLTDEITDVHTSPDYPQFEIAQCPVDAMYVKFTNEISGRFNSESNELLVRNLSAEYSLVIRSIEADGCTFDCERRAVVAPGEELLIPCEGIDDSDYICIEITYARQGEILTPAFTKAFYFTAA
ncbi:MAG: hypothetical protein IIW48_08735 [Clostridia bacterium]|nr:hypothetical protein [Clostridia bacterium]